MFNNIENVPAYCITLDRRPDRWQRFMGQTVAAGLHVKRWSAVDGQTIDVKTDERISVFTKRNIIEKTRRSHEELDSIGGVGCALSHISLWKKLIESTDEYMLIMEDDASVPTDFVERANTILAASAVLQNPDAWDVWMLGGAWKAEESDIANYKMNSHLEPVMPLGKFYLIHAYIINRRAASAFLANCFPIQAHIDHYMSMCARFNRLKVVGSPLLKIRQNGQTSDIQMKARCEICDVPSNIQNMYLWNRINVGMAAGIIGVILVGSTLFYKKY